MRNLLLGFIFCAICSNVYAQSAKKLANQNWKEMCDCINKIDVIDNKSEFEQKISGCIPLTKSDSIKLENENSLNDYHNELGEQIWKKCTKFNELRLGLLNELRNERIDSTFQSNEKWIQRLEGEYRLPGSRDPNAGGASLYIFKNQFIIVAYATLITGQWKVVNDKYLHLVPYKTKYPFAIYGRYNPEIGDSTKTVFEGRDMRDGVVIRYGKNEYNPVMNHDANCTPYPIKLIKKGKFNKIAITLIPYFLEENENQKRKTYTWNTKKYNDFIIQEYIESYHRNSIRAVIEEDGIIFKSEKIIKQPLPDSHSEEIEFLEQFSNESYTEPKSLFHNPVLKDFSKEEILHLYTYNNQLNIYEKKNPCKKYCPDEYDFEYSDHILEYKLLEEVSIKNEKVEFGKPLLNFECDHSYD